MAVTDSIADYLTRIRNAQQAGHRTVSIPLSSMKKSITEILYDQGYIYRYKVDAEDGPQGVISIALKYNRDRKPVIKSLGRISKPGLRKYAKSGAIPEIINGLGICIVSTSHGLMTDKKAREMNLGGELVCYVY
jgi:small subunit ribosomal protein S8